MKRTAFLLAFVFAAVSAVFLVFGTASVLIFSVVLWLMAAVFFVLRRRMTHGLKASALLILAAVYCFSLIAYDNIVIGPAKSLDKKGGQACCRITEEPESSNGVTYAEFTVVSKTVGETHVGKGLKLRSRLNAGSPLENASVGDIFTADLKFYAVSDKYKSGYYAKGRFVAVSIANECITGHENTLYGYITDVRKSVRKAVDENFYGDTAGLIKGLMLGDRSDMSEALYNDFKTSGVCHVTAVSGLHIGIICALISSLLGLFLSRRTAAAVSLPALVAVVGLTGFTPSAVRAGIMYAAVLLGRVILRRTDPLNSLGAAVIIMLMINPFYICDLGFQLSCAATLGIAVSSEYADNAARFIADKIRFRPAAIFTFAAVNSVLISFGAVFFTVPVQIIRFGTFSSVAPFASAVICPAAELTLVSAIIGTALYFIPVIKILTVPVFGFCGIMADFCSLTVKAIAGLPGASIGAMPLCAAVCLAVISAAVFFGMLLKNRLDPVYITAMLMSLPIVSAIADIIV